jgi:hypothetical protein
MPKCTNCNNTGKCPRYAGATCPVCGGSGARLRDLHADYLLHEGQRPANPPIPTNPTPIEQPEGTTTGRTPPEHVPGFQRPPTRFTKPADPDLPSWPDSKAQARLTLHAVLVADFANTLRDDDGMRKYVAHYGFPGFASMSDADLCQAALDANLLDNDQMAQNAYLKLRAR